MRIPFILLFLTYYSCSVSKQDAVIKKNKEIRVKVKDFEAVPKTYCDTSYIRYRDDCDYFFRNFKKPVLIVSTRQDLDYIYLFTEKQTNLLAYTNCLNGYSRTEIENLMGIPSKNTDLVLSYMFLQFDDKKNCIIKNELIFIFESDSLNKNTLKSIGSIYWDPK